MIARMGSSLATNCTAQGAGVGRLRDEPTAAPAGLGRVDVAGLGDGTLVSDLGCVGSRHTVVDKEISGGGRRNAAEALILVVHRNDCTSALWHGSTA